MEAVSESRNCEFGRAVQTSLRSGLNENRLPSAGGPADPSDPERSGMMVAGVEQSHRAGGLNEKAIVRPDQSGAGSRLSGHSDDFWREERRNEGRRGKRAVKYCGKRGIEIR
ncbi:hypothetical protein EYF80_041274 [Liparis tanakae]|uniref:Uncharacterized protein n=1 Tax=Liparis tanakae TaxID=230148 RepID=A0A4Z2G5W1_9TELE|nr:hypothetical protein EYF80_041274 [Liparis tanakae]